MSAINKIPSGIRALIIIAILAFLVWKITPRDFIIPSILIAVVILVFLLYLIYKSPQKPKKSPDKIVEKAQSEDISEAESNLQSGNSVQMINQRGKVPESNRNKPKATDEVAKYYRLASQSRLKEKENSKPFSQPKVTGSDEISNEETISAELNSTEVFDQDLDASKILEKAEISTTAMPIINEETSLTQEDKNHLVNAVWYRCENPFCKYTHFLDVHHIVDEKEGGTNMLSNLIVLCPYCHELAHKNEIPKSEMLTWIGNREERFKFKLEWPY